MAIPNAGPVNLYDKKTDSVVGHLAEPVPVKSLNLGDVVWDFCNDVAATFQGWSTYSSCYVFTWHDGCGDFCGWDLGGDRQPVMWRRVIMH